eukprot:TRINITY_DN2671_c0_g1_i1.p1 TRINITY_DN2671_c0_g1~~TRINITY_DN2671_c0_g1_i1.p1  ORF type:complete len:544 (-),score=116.99 TRINITY_DN2671_c0_g1_i1:90-1721(-)
MLRTLLLLPRSTTTTTTTPSIRSTVPGLLGLVPLSALKDARPIRRTFASLRDHRELPGPSVEEFFGAAMKNHFADYHVVLSDFCDRYGQEGIFRVPDYADPQRSDIVVNNPDLVSQVYQRQEFLDRPLAEFFLYAYGHLAQADPSKVEEDIERARTSRGKEGHQGITTRNGVEWGKHRRIATKALMAPKAVANFATHINESSKELVEALKREIEQQNGSSIEVNDLLAEYAFSVISKTALGSDAMDLSTPEGQAVYTAVKSLFHAARIYSMRPYPYEDGPELQTLRANLSKLREVFLGLLEKKRKNPANSSDFATMLYLTKDEETGSFLEPTQVLTDSLDIVSGGTDTTSFMLSIGLHLLAHHPDVADRVRAEVKSVLTERHGSADAQITNDDLAKMPFLLATTKEILRLFPSAPLGGRATTTAVDLNGYSIPEYTSIIIPNWNLHRNEKYWNNPLEFDPERFMTSEKGHHPFAWVPFGAGARSCIGQRISMAESRIALAYILRAFEILPIDDEIGKPYQDPDILFGITSQLSKPVKISLQPL